MFVPILQCCGPGMFYPGSGSKHFLIRIQTFLSSQIPDPTLKWNASLGTVLFLASDGFRSKVLVLVIVKKIRDTKKIIPDSDPGSSG
jgi:hypothetical protein